ncbi:MAG: hypothetical protein KC800_14105 [Candidatus Eremiobacteraeota bacterium]|nr:hypothetical protein [Candidatus Eremiobacteraeota bacterium]
MTSKPVIERAPFKRGQLNLASGRASVTNRRRPQSRYLRRMTRRLKTLLQLNRVGIGFRVTPHRDELIKAWTASYFLPMLKGKELARSERETAVEVPEEETLTENTGFRRVPRPQKGLRLPRIFAPCKRFEHAR